MLSVGVAVGEMAAAATVVATTAVAATVVVTDQDSVAVAKAGE